MDFKHSLDKLFDYYLVASCNPPSNNAAIITIGADSSTPSYSLTWSHNTHTRIHRSTSSAAEAAEASILVSCCILPPLHNTSPGCYIAWV